MKIFQGIIVFLVCFTLAACNDLTDFIESLSSTSEENTSEEVTNTEEVEANEIEQNINQEENDMDDNTSESNEESFTNNRSITEETTHSNQNNATSESNATSNENQEAIDTETILRKSYQAMESLNSIFMESTWELNEMQSDENFREERQINSLWILTEPFAQRHRLTINPIEPAGETQITETYKIDGKHYVHYPNDIWRYEENAQGSDAPTPFITDDTLESSLQYADRFEVVEEDDHYYLTFSGNLDEFMDVMWGGPVEFVSEVLRMYQMELTDIMNSYHMIIEKETFFVRQYDLHYEAEMEEADEFFVVFDTVMSFGNYNNYGEMELPQEVLDEAEPF